MKSLEHHCTHSNTVQLRILWMPSHPQINKQEMRVGYAVAVGDQVSRLMVGLWRWWTGCTCASAAPAVGLVVSADVEADHLLGVLVVVDGVAPLHKQGVQVKQVPWVVGWGGKPLLICLFGGILIHALYAYAIKQYWGRIFKYSFVR